MPESVSIVITCHNLERYIGLAIESVFNQDYLGPVDVLVIDDCSTDQSAEIINSYGGIRYLRTEKNLGVLMATIIGLENTSGDLVFFLDGDDIWEPSKLSTIVERFRDDQLMALVTHDLKYIDGNGNFLGQKSFQEEMIKALPSPQKDTMIRDGILLHADYVWLGSAYAVNRTLGNLKDFCIFAKTLPDPMNTYQDWPLAFWVACQSQVRFGYVPQKLFQYRLHGLNHSGDNTNLAKASRNFRRSFNTVKAITQIAKRFDADAHVQKMRLQQLAFYAYLVDLYAGLKWRATIGFFGNLSYLTFSNESFLKETIRFIGIQIFGARYFIFFKNFINK